MQLQQKLKPLSPSAVQFPIGDYAGEAAELAAMTREEVVAMLKRGSTGFSRGRSKYRGVTSEAALQRQRRRGSSGAQLRGPWLDKLVLH